MEGDFYVCCRTNQIYNIIGHFTCKSNYVCYLLFCTKCGVVASVGSTEQPANQRIGQHIGAILKNKDGKKYPMVAHFNQIGSECYDADNKIKHLRAMIIGGISANSEEPLTRQAADQRLNKREQREQGNMLTMVGIGGNSTTDYNNGGKQRRNYTTKFKGDNVLINLVRPVAKKKIIKNWNKTWIQRMNSSTSNSQKPQKIWSVNSDFVNSATFFNSENGRISKVKYDKTQNSRKLNKLFKPKTIPKLVKQSRFWRNDSANIRKIISLEECEGIINGDWMKSGTLNHCCSSLQRNYNENTENIKADKTCFILSSFGWTKLTNLSKEDSVYAFDYNKIERWQKDKSHF